MSSPPPNQRRDPPPARPEPDIPYYVENFCNYLALTSFIVLLVAVLVSFEPNVRGLVFGVWSVVQLVLGLLSGTASILGSTVGLSARIWCAVPGPQWGCSHSGASSRQITLELAARHVKHAAVTSLDVCILQDCSQHDAKTLCSCLIHSRGACRPRLPTRCPTSSMPLLLVFLGSPPDQPCSIWAMPDALSALDKSISLPEARHLASTLVTLKDTLVQVEDGVSDINRLGWHAFSSMDDWIQRAHKTILRQRAARIVDSQELHSILTQMNTLPQGNIDDLIIRIDRTLVHARVGLDVASEARKKALAVNMELTRRLEDTSLPRKTWEKSSHALRAIDGHAKNVQKIYEAMHDLQAQLELVRRYLVDYRLQSKSIDLRVETDAM